MARPRKEGLDYFPHDTDAAGDEKVEPLHLLYGPDGYAFYFILLERIYRTPEAELDVSSPILMGTLAAKVRIGIDRFKEILDTALTIGSFDRARYEQDGVLTSNGIKKRAQRVQGEREKWRKDKELENTPGGGPDVSAEFSTEKTELSVEKKDIIHAEKPEKSTQTHLLSLSLSEKEEGDKVEATKRMENLDGKGRRKKQEPEKTAYAEFVSLTNDEYSSLVARLRSDQRARRAIEILDNYKGSSGKNYKSDYRTILNWVIGRLEEEEAKSKGGLGHGGQRKQGNEWNEDAFYNS